MNLRRHLRLTWHLPAVVVSISLLVAGSYFIYWIASPRPRVVRLSGSHYQIGVQHGRLLRGEIRSLYDAYITHGLIEHEGLSAITLAKAARHYDAFVPQPLRDEMRGIADGADLPYEQIVIMNTFADALLGRGRFCSAVSVHDGDGALLVGRNLDWVNHGVAHRSGIVFVLEPTGERRVLSVAWPGFVGVVTGMNDRGLVISMNMAFANDLDSNATPSLMRIRDILDRDSSVDTAIADATRTPRTMAMNWMVADGSNASVLELSGHQSAIRPIGRGCAVTTNYYESLPLHGGFGGDRSATLREKLGNGAASEGAVERALLRVAFVGPSEGVNTVQSVVFEPTTHTAHVAIGRLPAPAGRFFRIAM